MGGTPLGLCDADDDDVNDDGICVFWNVNGGLK